MPHRKAPHAGVRGRAPGVGRVIADRWNGGPDFSSRAILSRAVRSGNDAARGANEVNIALFLRAIANES